MTKLKKTKSFVPSRSLTISFRPFDRKLNASVLLIPVTKRRGRIHVPTLPQLPTLVQQRLDELINHNNGQSPVGAIDQQILPKSAPFQRLLLINLGETGAIKLSDIRLAAAASCEWCSKAHLRTAVLAGDVMSNSKTLGKISAAAFAQAWVEGLCLSRFRYTAMRTTNGDTGLNGLSELVIATSAAPTAALRRTVQRAQIIADNVNLSRFLGHEPPNIINPVTLAQRCRQIAKSTGLTCRVLDEHHFRAQKMGGILAVGEGSHTKPRIIILEHRGRNPRSAPVVLIGKAVTHDSGGYSIKPATSLPDMKYDKCGGMAVLATMIAAAKLNLSQRIIGVLGAAENMISSTAYRAGDIIRMFGGKTVEVLNTDAEGRIILAECLHLAETTYKPAMIIDLATLTGACDVALGSACAGLMSNNDKLAAALIDSSERTNERLWQLPLWPVYREQIIGGDADLKNSGGRGAGAITAGMFLKEFVNEKTPWAHLDIAATARTDRATPLCPVGATGFGVRLLLDFLQHRE